MSAWPPPPVASGTLDSFADADIGAAAAYVARHRRIDVGVVGMWSLGKQRSRRHDLPRLAVAALNHSEIEPGLLHLGARRGGADALDRGDGAVANRFNRQKTRAHRSAVDMHGAGATLGDATAIFSARHTKHIAQHQAAGFRRRHR